MRGRSLSVSHLSARQNARPQDLAPSDSQMKKLGASAGYASGLPGFIGPVPPPLAMSSRYSIGADYSIGMRRRQCSGPNSAIEQQKLKLIRLITPSYRIERLLPGGLQPRRPCSNRRSMLLY